MTVDRFKKVKQVLWIILFANLAVAALKLIIGTMIKSASMTADGFHSLADGSSNIVGLIGIHFASKPVDDDHPYGHRKYEHLASFIIAGMLFAVGCKIIIESFTRFIHPVIPEITAKSLIVLFITLIVNIFVCWYEFRTGKKLNSQILVSDSMHTRSDIYVTIGVLATLIGVKLGLPPIIDPIASLVVSGFILYAAYEIFNDASAVLVDKAVVDIEDVREIVLSFDQVKDAHKIRSRGCGYNLHIDMHIVIEPHVSIEESHYLVHMIEEKLKEQINVNVQIIAHVEPFSEVKIKI
jgi:cation diffusion facilitator family transporter